MVDASKSKDFFRTSDSTYLGYITNTSNKANVEVSIDFAECSPKHLKPEKRRSVVNKLFQDRVATQDNNILCAGLKRVYFSDNGKNFVLRPKGGVVLRVLVVLFGFLKIIKNESKVVYEIIESNIPHLIYKPKIAVNLPDPSPLKIADCEHTFGTSKAYSDPYTQIATALFQDYEPFHSWKDVKNHPYRDASDYQLILENDTLSAKRITDQSVSKDSIVKTLTSYRRYVRDQFGEEVLNRIQIHYEFNLDDMIRNASPLTPEIIYRINVGTGHIEASDVYELATTIEQGNKLPRRIQEKLKEKMLENPDFPQKFIPDNPEHFALLANLLQISESEHESIFTGRKLHGKISSWYTQGDDSLFKPWVDQQEFAQTCFRIPNRNWNCFYEDLSMILCKKHLHQKNSDGTYRVGTLIPAPKKPGEAQAYYKVTSWIHNSRGIYSYTLEPACPGTHLPAIKLYRSTSVSSYNLDGASSYKNDFNPINPPGYEGSHLLEPYEKEFFDKRTIPVWVGYQSCADSALTNLAANDLDTASEIRSNLLAANTALTREIEAKYKKPTLKQFIRKYDSEFMELVSACRDSGVIGAYQAWYLLSNSLRNTVKYKYSEHSKEVVYLKNFLEKAAATGQFHSQANELLSWWNWQDKSPTEKEQKMLQTLQAHKDACFDQSLSLDALTASLKTWNSSIHEWAKASKEDLASKTMQNVDFAGHSLGAACAQRFLVNYTAAKGRIPLPGHTIAARLFDDPAINKEDNKAFILFGNKHSKLLQSLKASYTITRRQETGDPVPESGEIHLGATKNEEQQKQMYTWLRFDATLQKPSSKARDPQIRDYTTAHGRLFAGGISRGGWLRGWLSDKISQLQYSNAEVAAQLRENLKSMPIADYKVVHYDSCTQWNFDKPSDLKIWATLRKLWKMPFSFTPIFAERLRTYLSAAFRSGFFHVFLPKFIAQLGQANPPDDVAHGDWQKHCDEKRVFVVPKPQIKANSINPTTISDKLAE